MSVNIQLDSASVANFKKQMDYLKKGGSENLLRSLYKVGYRMRTEAMLRLQSCNHVVTARLKNSIFVKAKAQNEANKATGQQMQYSDNLGNTFSSDLQSVHLFDDEIAIGTNVEYATKIEYIDSFLYWAVKNTDLSRSVTELMTEEMKKRPKGGRAK